MTNLKTYFRELFEAETFKARSKESGKLVQFKSKDAYDAAVKAGTHEDPKAPKSGKAGGKDSKKDVPKANIFDKPSKSEPAADSMATVNSIASMTGLRTQAVAGWADENGVNLSKVADDIKSKKLKPMDFMTAVSGNPGNKYAKDIIAKYSNSSSSKASEPTSQSEPKQSSKPDTQGDKFELGTPAVYTDNGQEYRGEVVMNPSNQRVQINGQWTTIGKGTTKGIQVYGSDTFIVPDNWNDAKSFDDAMSEPAQPKQQRKGNPAVNKEVKGLAEKEGFTPSQLGKEEYKTKMMQAAVSALSDANFHDEARALVAKLEGKPEWASKPEYPSMDDPDFDDKMAAIRTNSSEASKFMQPDGKTWSFGRQIARTAGYDGVDAVDGLAFTLRMNGFHKEADAIQSVVQESYKGNISLKKLVEAKKYDIGSGWMGNGLTIWNRAEEQHGDYKIIAHIGKDGTLSIRDKQLPTDIKKMFQIWADSMKKGDRPGTY